VTDGNADWSFLRQQGGSPLRWIEHAGSEVDVTVNCVCSTCNQKWMHRLEDRVAPFLKPMFDGNTVTLNRQQQHHLARWAVKTATVFECDDPPERPRTPRSVCAGIRLSGLPPTYGVFLSKYSGPRILDRWRTVWTHRYRPDEHISQSSLLVGSVLIHVLADPWAHLDRRPTVDASAANRVISLCDVSVATDTDDDQECVQWPPEVSTKEREFEVLVRGLNAGMYEAWMASN
jgi:hypothetical protein